MKESRIRIKEIFLSIQGEAEQAGLPTIFVRTVGCNLRCSYCDTKYAYEGGTDYTVNQVVDKIIKLKCKRVCFTGGEPLLWTKHISEIIQILQRKCENEYKITIETNGAVDISTFKEWRTRGMLESIVMDWKLPSSGMNKKMLIKNINYLTPGDQVKYVIGNKTDYQEAKRMVKVIGTKAHHLFSSVFKKIDPKWIVKQMLKDKLFDVRFQIQMHKVIWDPGKRGV
jgi:7-carboxy-7-deazaguanine synthase